jgi:3-hydroxyacyl-CoA dehydrogenase
VKAAKSNDVSVATAMRVAKDLKKTAVITSDSTGFVVNRLLGYLLGEAMKAVDEGIPFEEVADAIAPLGLPMNPFDLLELVGLQVGAHVLDSMYGYDPEAIKIVSGRTRTRSKEQVFDDLIVGLTKEIKLMLDEKVVSSAEDIDLCMIMGAGWPFHLGGITPYLDRIGASQKVFGATFHNPMIKGV